jgi:hypothetical protein
MNPNLTLRPWVRAPFAMVSNKETHWSSQLSCYSVLAPEDAGYSSGTAEAHASRF